MSIIDSLPILSDNLTVLAESYRRSALDLFLADPLSYGLCTKTVCFCDPESKRFPEDCLNNDPHMHAFDLWCAFDDAVDLFPLDTENDIAECLEQMNCLYKSFTTPVEPVVRLIWNLQASGMKVEANALYLSDQEKGELVCDFFQWDKTVENNFNSGEINGVEVPNFSYHPEKGLLV